MLIISAQQLHKYHGAQLVLENLALEIRSGDRIGLIGRNGSGKSTLLRLLAGLDTPDEGQLAVRKDTRIGYLAQIPELTDETSVYDVLARGYRHALAIKARMTELEAAMSSPEAAADERRMTKLLGEYADAQERFEHEGGYEMEKRIEQVASGLGIAREQLGRSFASLSGGEKTKAALASLLIERPDLLLLDEPTNHIDLNGVEWLEQYLRSYDGACVLVSHDRYFLDRVVTQVIELEDGELSAYATNYTGYVKEKEERLLREFAAYQDQQKKIAKMEESIKRLLTWGRQGDNEKFIKRAASMQKALDRIERLKRPVLDPRSAEFALTLADRSGRDVAQFEGLRKAYGERAILDGISGLLRYGEKTVLIGDNGAGKSTLFRLLLGELAPDDGTVSLGARVEVGYLGQEEAPEEGKKSVLQHFREETAVEEGAARGLLARYLLFGPDVFKPISKLSGGEWTRLRLAVLMRRKPNLLLLDEPTNHLDIASREALEEALDAFPGTVLAISHDRYFINRIADAVWSLGDGKLATYIGNFDAYREQRDRLQQMQEGAEAVPAAAKVGKPGSGGRTVRMDDTEGSACAAEGSDSEGKPGVGTQAATQAGTVGKPGQESRAGRRPAAQGKTQPAAVVAGAVDPARLEREIEAAEARLAALDSRLAATDYAAEAEAYERLWSEREAEQQALERLYESWMAREQEAESAE
ncbi:ribosomal protection-like ABC-F family protein [Cohnella nanjingensis]|uniref:ABC-F family ATP-binding cassette domain-containing protein n=1 Tax=Cohnella nanjingensis TaxID=1387779 RepID=A0A7X0RPB8_9BACL|nr:ABC-F family ATP-binding cassette domain-containing protein [Cohnella nanjingensis]MBB6671232.1 ABC-F family ATP-binding cassette domain-containing protein [Cohnella nanjingensis]